MTDITLYNYIDILLRKLKMGTLAKEVKAGGGRNTQVNTEVRAKTTKSKSG